jgi:hypothetical protein
LDFEEDAFVVPQLVWNMRWLVQTVCPIEVDDILEYCRVPVDENLQKGTGFRV